MRAMEPQEDGFGYKAGGVLLQCSVCKSLSFGKIAGNHGLVAVTTGSSPWIRPRVTMVIGRRRHCRLTSSNDVYVGIVEDVIWIYWQQLVGREGNQIN